MKLLLCVVILFGVSYSYANTLNGIWANKKGIAYLTGELPEQAIKKFNEALLYDPFNGVFKLNLGVTHEVLEDLERAKKYYEIVAVDEMSHPQARFAAYLNLGRLYSGTGNIEQALDSYQKALSFQPESIEVKTNIEMLWQQQQNDQNNQSGQSKKDQQSKKGKDPNDDEPKDGEGEQQPEQQSEPKPSPEKDKKKKPKEFNSKELTKSDVRKILNELKKQEQQIREKEFGQKVKERPLDKDW